jgi:TolB-like protein/Tfp pilus assembly protein PilF
MAESGGTPAVFISYASQDSAAAGHLCGALRAAGIEVWFDQSELRGGDAWDQAIRKQIKACSLFIPVISRNTRSRDEGYFRLEWKLAIDRSHLMAEDKTYLLPVVVDDTPDDDARVPDRFREIQWTRLPDGRNSGAFVERVTRLLSSATEPAPIASHAPPKDAPSTLFVAAKTAAAAGERGKMERWRWTLVIGFSLLVGAIGYLVLDRFLASKRATSGAASQSESTMPHAAPENSIAVLPFVDMSEKKDQEYFADGMAEEILDVLAKIPQLSVISRTSSFQFKRRDVDAKTIGSTLGARYIVEGSVRKSGDRLRINAQLVDTRDGSHRWSESYDRGVGDAFKVQDEIAASLVRALELAVGAGEVPARLSPKNAASYDLYLRGRQAFDRYDRDGFEQAAELYRQALELDPQFAPAASALASVQLYMAQWGYVSPKTGYEGARQAAELAMKLDPHLAGPHTILAAVALQYDWDWPAAERENAQASALDPRDPLGGSFRGLVSLAMGRLNDSTSQMNAALRLDPLNPNILFTRGWALFWAGHLPEAEASLRKSLQISPTYESAHYYLGNVLFARGELAEALAEMDRELDNESRLAGFASVQFAMGHKRESDAALAQLTKIAADDWASGIASVYAIRNEPDAAFEWLDRAYAQKDEDLYLIKGNPLFRNVARDSRYAAFLRKMKLPE